jgi:Bacterial regulatory helix-turn-helix protein, lysR family
MGLRHLRYFVAVVQALSFTKGAEKLHLAQPSLTPQIRDLEEEIGVRLLDRSKGRVSLTPEGQSFLVDAKRVLDLSEEIVEPVRHFSRHELAPLNIRLRRKPVLRPPAGNTGIISTIVPDGPDRSSGNREASPRGRLDAIAYSARARRDADLPACTAVRLHGTLDQTDRGCSDFWQMRGR